MARIIQMLSGKCLKTDLYDSPGSVPAAALFANLIPKTLIPEAFLKICEKGPDITEFSSFCFAV